MRRRPLDRQAREPRRARSATGAELVEARHPRRRGARATAVERAEPGGDLPPRRPDRRAQVGRRPGLRRAHQRGGHDQRARGRAGARRAAGRQHLDRRRDLRRGPASSRRPRTTRPRPRRPTASRSSAPRATARSSRRLHGLSTVSLRYGNVYGPRQDPLGEAGVIAIFCGKLLEGGRPTIFGDGQQTRDYVYVGDVVDANLRAARHRRDRRVQRRARRRRRACSTSSRRSRAHSNNGFEAEHAPAAPGRGAAHRARPLARARGARLGGAGRPGRGPRAARSTRCAEPERGRTLLGPGEGETHPPRLRDQGRLARARPHRVGLRAGRHGPDPHVHHDHVDSFFVLEGQLEWRVGPDARAARRRSRQFRLGPARRAAHASTTPARARRASSTCTPPGSASSVTSAATSRSSTSTTCRRAAASPPTGVIVLGPGEGERLELGESTATIKVGVEADRRVRGRDRLRLPAPAGAQPPEHDGELLRARGRARPDPRRRASRRSGAGGFAAVPPGTVHTSPPSAAPLRFLNVFTPGGMEHYVREAVRLGEPPDPAGYDIEFV